jgi:hypothetical protein
MKRPIPLGWLMTGLVAWSAIVYAIDYVVNPALRDTMGFYTLLDLAFIPVNVLIVGLFINRLIAARERQELLHKMNMVIGAFFSQTGNSLIRTLSRFDTGIESDRQHLLFNGDWKASDYELHGAAVRGERHDMRLDASDIAELRETLAEHRPFILNLLQNGNLLEHASFSDMLWAISHLGEELAAREDLTAISASDRRHLEIDMGRAYGRLLGEWLLYAHHLQVRYPYLFSFAVRTNPFDPGADIEIKA